MSEVEAVANIACPCAWSEETLAIHNVVTKERGFLDVGTPGVVHVTTPTVMQSEGNEPHIVAVRSHGKKYGTALDIVRDGWRPL